jgi:hypothetical protein
MATWLFSNGEVRKNHLTVLAGSGGVNVKTYASETQLIFGVLFPATPSIIEN